MDSSDYDIVRLAALLRVDPAGIARLAERGKIPGRRVAGEWRFSPAEITHWLESQMGESTDEQLAQMESALAYEVSPADLEATRLETLLPTEGVAIPLAGKTKQSIISEMVALAQATGRLWDAAKMVDAVRGREDLHSTALDNGVALLHPRRPQSSILAEPIVVFGRTASPIPFGASQLTDIFFLLCSYDDRGHLRTLARLSRIIADSQVLDDLRAAEDSQAARQVLLEADAKLEA
jgi:PTS system nitrogen regulatory IIA component